MPKKKALDTAKLIQMVEDETPQAEIMKKLGFKTSTQLKNAYMSALIAEGKVPAIKSGRGVKKPSAPINFAEGLAGDLLIVHGTGETNTHLGITEGLVDRLIELGKRFDYMSYPNREHGLREGKGTPIHLRLLMTRYLLEHLPAGAR